MEEFVIYCQSNINKILILTWQHFYLFLISMIIAVIVGFIIAVFASQEGKEKLNELLISITGAAQAVPSVAVIALAFLFVGIGIKPAVIALAVYSIVPIVFNITSGFKSIDSSIIEAARGMGYTNGQILFRIKIPIAMPVIMAGIRNAATINIGSAAIASIIGGGGLGDLIFIGLRLNRSDILLAGAFFTAVLAILVDNILCFAEMKIVPGGIKIKER